jgi:hypothetical protein
MSEDIFRRVITTGVFLSFIAVVVQTALLFVVYRRIKVTQVKAVRVVNTVLSVIGIIHRFAEENAPKFFEIATYASEGAKSLKEQANGSGFATYESGGRRTETNNPHAGETCGWLHARGPNGTFGVVAPSTPAASDATQDEVTGVPMAAGYPA